jgi:catechol 2,3-dioxygenase-like lactoylglutathione lyase family enzyme
MACLHQIVSFGVACGLASTVAMAQPQTVVMVPVPSPASGVEHRIQSVADLDLAFAFYRDVVGLPVLQAPADATTRFPEALARTTGARVRAARLDLPGAGTGLLLVEFAGVEQRPQRPSLADPGASALIVRVRDVGVVLAAAHGFGTPVAVDEGRVRATTVLVDPDGFFVEVDHDAAPAGDVTPGNVVGVHVAFTVADVEPVVSFYRDVLGFAIERPVTDGGRVARVARIPGSPLAWEFRASPGGAGMVHAGRLKDPGAPAMAVRVPNVRVAAEAARRAGLPVLSAAGEPVMRAAGGRVLIRDPGGLLLEVVN